VTQVLAVERLGKDFKVSGGLLGPKGLVQAVDDCSFAVAKNEVLGLVGESGSGKSTLARLLMCLIRPDRGRIVLENAAVDARSADERRRVLSRVQMVFQDSYASLNPRHTAAAEVAFGLAARGEPRRAAERQACEALALVGLTPNLFAERYPHELSGGQRQRVNIARAIALSPKILILDEAVSALDKSVQAQVLNLLGDLKRTLGLTYLFISHDLEVVRYVSDRIVVMYLGKVMEIGSVDVVYDAPAHPYTKALISSRLTTDPKRRTSAAPVTGDPPSPINPPPGCRFSSRCPIAEPICRAREPKLSSLRRDPHHLTACHAHITDSGHSLASARKSEGNP